MKTLDSKIRLADGAENWAGYIFDKIRRTPKITHLWNLLYWRHTKIDNLFPSEVHYAAVRMYL